MDGGFGLFPTSPNLHGVADGRQAALRLRDVRLVLLLLGVAGRGELLLIYLFIFYVFRSDRYTTREYASSQLTKSQSQCSGMHHSQGQKSPC